MILKKFSLLNRLYSFPRPMVEPCPLQKLHKIYHQTKALFLNFVKWRFKNRWAANFYDFGPFTLYATQIRAPQNVDFLAVLDLCGGMTRIKEILTWNGPNNAPWCVVISICIKQFASDCRWNKTCHTCKRVCNGKMQIISHIRTRDHIFRPNCVQW